MFVFIINNYPHMYGLKYTINMSDTIRIINDMTSRYIHF